jgi:hypothetical protein
MIQSSFRSSKPIRRWLTWNEPDSYSSAEEIFWRRDTQQRNAVSQIEQERCSAGPVTFSSGALYGLSGMSIGYKDVSVEQRSDG